MELIDAIYGRRAVRSYRAGGVTRDTVASLIEVAIQAPSAMNLQPWVFAVVEGAGRLAEFSKRAKAHLLATIPAHSPLGKYRDMLTDPTFDIFYGAACLIVICARPPVQQSMEDCCLAAQNLLLAAHGRGLGTCWIGFARPWLELEATRAELGIPADCIPVVPIILGEPAAIPAPTERHKPVVIWTASRDVT